MSNPCDHDFWVWIWYWRGWFRWPFTCACRFCGKHLTKEEANRAN